MRYAILKITNPVPGANPNVSSKYKITNTVDGREPHVLSTLYAPSSNLEILFSRIESYQEDSEQVWNSSAGWIDEQSIIAEAETIQELKLSVPWLFL